MTRLIVIWANGKTDVLTCKSKEEALKKAENATKNYNVTCYIAETVIYSKTF